MLTLNNRRRTGLLLMSSICMAASLSRAEEPLPMTRHELPGGRVYYAVTQVARPSTTGSGQITVVGSPSSGSSAPPIAGKSPGTCTNVCEYWDDHTRRCEPLPDGTPVPGQCCTVCDGKGETRKQRDGEECAQCKAAGKCCGGNCIPIPLTPCDPGNPGSDQPENWTEKLQDCKEYPDIWGNPNLKYCYDGEVKFNPDSEVDP